MKLYIYIYIYYIYIYVYIYLYIFIYILLIAVFIDKMFTTSVDEILTKFVATHLNVLD